MPTNQIIKNKTNIKVDKKYELCRAVEKLAIAGKKFCVDYGYDNAVQKAKEL